jgi:hypothetical protein
MNLYFHCSLQTFTMTFALGMRWIGVKPIKELEDYFGQVQVARLNYLNANTGDCFVELELSNDRFRGSATITLSLKRIMEEKIELPPDNIEWKTYDLDKTGNLEVVSISC